MLNASSNLQCLIDDVWLADKSMTQANIKNFSSKIQHFPYKLFKATNIIPYSNQLRNTKEHLFISIIPLLIYTNSYWGWEVTRRG